MVEKVDEEEFERLLEGDKPVVCDFYADWCGPCKMLAPIMDSVAELYSGKAEFVKVNIDENMELAARYRITSIPFVGVFREGQLTDRSIGYMDKAEVDGFIKKSL